MCLSPLTISLNNEFIEVPCRQCSECRSERRNSLLNNAFAIYYDNLKYHAWFITLTYDDLHLPHNLDDIPVLNAKDLTLYFKRLRNHCNDFKYIACGEYGKRKSRPHYHVILFAKVGSYDWHDFIDLWGLGHVDISLCRSESAMRYVCKYITKPHQYDTDFLKDKYLLYSDRYPFVDDINNLPINVQRKIMSDFGISLQFVRRSCNMLDFISDNKQLKQSINFINNFQLSEYEKSSFCNRVRTLGARERCKYIKKYLSEKGIDTERKLRFLVDRLINIRFFSGSIFLTSSSIKKLYGDDSYKVSFLRLCLFYLNDNYCFELRNDFKDITDYEEVIYYNDKIRYNIDKEKRTLFKEKEFINRGTL